MSTTPPRRAVLRAALGALGGLGTLAGCGAGDGPPAPRLDTMPPGGWWGVAMDRGHRLRADAGLALGTTGTQGGQAGTEGAAHPPQPAAASGGVPTQHRCDVAILGAGVAGLAAARALRQAGIEDLRLFELEDQAGGNARSHQMGGMACPTGAHYLPVPSAPAHEVVDWLHEIGLLRQVLGRTVPDERHLCHSPQERLWLHGPWTEGLLPPAEPGSARLAQYQRFAQRVDEARRQLGFALPSRRAPWGPGHAALDAQTFAHWLDRQGLTDPGLRWYLDYACRDDYGGDARTVSAWAGLHYFGSRHGFHAPGDESAERDAVFTWPEGNAWLTRRLAATLGDRLQTGALVTRVEPGRHGVQIHVRQGPTGQPQRWTAQQVVLALPLHVAGRILAQRPEALRQVLALGQQAPWLVANVQLKAPLVDKPGAAPAWDNVLLPDGVPVPPPSEGGLVPATATATAPPAAPPSRTGPQPGALPEGLAGAPLGYVDARHQSLQPVAGPTVLTAYWALGDGSPDQRRQRRAALAQTDWRPWGLRVLQELARAHPDLPGKTVAISLVRHGHAMAMPVPGYRGMAALAALAATSQPGAPGEGATRLHWAHADLAGYSVFEEAFTLGHGAGQAAAAALRRRRP